MRANIGVVFGGKSVEHEISIISAIEVMNYLDSNKYNVIPIYVDKENTWYTGMHLKDILHYRDIDLVNRYATKVSLVKDDKRILLRKINFPKKDLHILDLIIPIGHGAYLEDGNLQGYLTTLGIAYTGSSTLASAIGQDKVITKQLLQANDIAVVPYTWFYDYQFQKSSKEIINKIEKELKYPLFVKPATLGSSIGVAKVSDAKELSTAIKNAIVLDKKILVEEAINNPKELNISVMGDYEKQEVSAIEEINVDDEFYTFKEKYVDGLNKVRPLKKGSKIISKELQMAVEETALKAFQIINASGIIRVDFLFDSKANKLYVNEINTCPGSLAQYLWLESNVRGPELLDDYIKIAIKNRDKRREKKEAFAGNLLENYDNLRGKKNKKSE